MSRSTPDVAERERKAAAVALLRAEGLNGIQIAERLGISRSYAYELLNDPEGDATRKRKAKAGGTCIDCGGPTAYGNGDTVGPSKRCWNCRKEHVHETRKWTPEAIVAAIQEWAEITGKQPSATNWNTAHPLFHGDIARIFYEGDYPATNTVRLVFGSWNAAIAAAGFTPTQAKGRQGLGQVAYDRTVRAYQAGEPISSIALREGISAAGVRQRLIRLGVYAPPTRKKEVMAAALKAEQVIEREIERAERRAEALREELAEVEETATRLRAAQEAMAAPQIKAVA